ncbi:hypothetical protein [Pseudonocardia adelaidensis]|uniref:hypothetical protein n=1 Tax=Pseudonocardia adelaidensis TaxID=648754 RepID=UPI0031E9E143
MEEPQYLHEGKYLGQTVTIQAAVSAVPAEDRIEDDETHHGDDSRLVITQGVDVAVGDVVQFTGTVGQHDVTMEAEAIPPVRHDKCEKYESEPFLYDARVEALPASVSRRNPASERGTRAREAPISGRRRDGRR